MLMHLTWQEAATRLNGHYEAFRAEHGQPPTLIFAPAYVICVWLDFPINVIPDDTHSFRGVALRSTTGNNLTQVYSPLC